MESASVPPQPQQPQQAQPAPQAETPEQSDRALLEQIVAEQKQHREEVAALRAQLDEAKQRPVAGPSAQPLSPEDALRERMQHISEHDYYCPACGLTYDYRQRCTGRAESPHPPCEVVSTDELKSGDSSKHSAPEYV